MITIAVVGRPNVGKSTLFNVLSKNKKSIIHNSPGITRDYKISEVELGGIEFRLIDTAGLHFMKKLSPLEKEINQSTEKALEKSDLVFFVVDGREGLTDEDKNLSKFLRKKNIPVVLLVNKCDTRKTEENMGEFFKLGYKNICKISAEHRVGIDHLYQFIAHFDEELAQKTDSTNEETSINKIKIAIIGRPNVGKSTFVNALIGENRLITGPEPGITRDSIEVPLSHKGYALEIIDTAGLRKKMNVQRHSIEQLSVDQTISSIDLADITILMVDINTPLESQDLRIISLAISRGKPLILVCNKVDTITSAKQLEEIKEEVEYLVNTKASNIKDLVVIYISALYKKNIRSILDSCIKQYKIWGKRVQTSKLNEWLRYVLEEYQPPLTKSGVRIKIKYISQVRTKPPTFCIFSNKPGDIPNNYMQYLSNKIKSDLGFTGVPVNIVSKASSNPYASND